MASSGSLSRSLSPFLLFTIMFGIMSANKSLAAGRGIPKMPTTTNEPDVKVPEFFIDQDGSVLLPGIGRIMVPMPFGGSSQTPSLGGDSDQMPPSDGSDQAPPSGDQMPGGDDTTMPDPSSDGQTPVPDNGVAQPPAGC